MVMPAGSSPMVIESALTPGRATWTWIWSSTSTMSTGGSQDTTSWVKNWRWRRCARSSIDRASPHIQLEKSRDLTAVRWRLYPVVQVGSVLPLPASAGLLPLPACAGLLPLPVNRTPRRHGYGLLVLVPVVDPATRHVVGRDLEAHAVAGEDADAVLAHAAAGVGEHGGAVLERDAEIRVRQHLLHGSVHLQHFFLGHSQAFTAPSGARAKR